MARITNDIANATYEQTISGDNVTITITCETGYIFDGAIAFSGDDNSGDWTEGEFTIDSTGAIATATITNASEGYLTLTGNTKQASGADVTNNIANTSFAQATTGTDLTITITCETGYIFDGAISYSGDDNSGDYIEGVFTIDSTGKIATATITNASEGIITLTGNTKQETATLTITNNIADTTETHTESETNVTIVVSYNRAYNNRRFLNSLATYTTTDGTQAQITPSQTIVSDVPTATFVCPNVDYNTPIVLTGNVGRVCLITGTIDNAVITGLQDYYTTGDTIAITATANENTEFADAPTASGNDSQGDPVSVSFVVSDDKKTATLNYTLTGETGTFATDADISLYGGATPVTPVGTNYGAINVYIVSMDNLQAFAALRFTQETDPTTGQITYIDLGDYVNRIKRLPLLVDALSTDVIKCGNYNTAIACETPKDDIVTADFGTITLPQHNMDANDYNETQISLFVPFSGFVDVPNTYVGKDIRITYEINVITGGAIAKLYCGDIMFNAIAVDVSQDIIYRTANEQLTTIGGDQWNDNFLYGLKPFAVITWHSTGNITGTPNNANERAVLGTLTGFIAATDVTAIANETMLANEQNEIYDLLETGVYLE